MVDPLSAAVSSTSRILIDSAGTLDPSSYHKKLADRISELKEEIRLLNSYHNVVTPTCRLPPEILSDIFLDLSAMTPLSCFWVSHVCEHWRSVALACPLLWTRIQFVGSPAFADLMSTRACKAPLEVIFLSDDDQYYFEEVLSSILSRTDTLRVVKLESSHGRNSLDIPCSSTVIDWTYAPLLETLVLINRPENHRSFHDTFLKRGAPALQHLDMRYLGLRWRSLPLGSHIRTLRLWGESEVEHHRPSVEEFVAGIKEMVRLEKLELQMFAPAQLSQLTAANSPIATSISFPALRSLQIFDTAEYISHFFSIIETPNSASVVVKFLYARPRDSAINQALANLKKAFKTDSQIQEGLRGLDICGRAFYRCFRFYVEGDHPHAAPLLSIEFESMEQPFPPIHDTLSALDVYFTTLSTLHSLRVEFNHMVGNDSEDVWRLLQRHGLPGVQTLTLDSIDLVPFLRVCEQGFALNEEMVGTASNNHRGDTAERRYQPSFPALTTLICRGIAFHKPDLVNRRRRLAKELGVMLRKRTLRGSPLKELHLVTCRNFGYKDARLLRDTVLDMKLIWDGYEDYYASDDSEY